MIYVPKFKRKVPHTKEGWYRFFYLLALALFLGTVLVAAIPKPAISEENRQAPIIAPAEVPNPCGLDVVVCPEEAPQGQIEPPKAIVTAQPPANRPKSENEARIREIAKEIGMTLAQENLAVQIGYCESGLRTNALGDGGKSRGIWQIWKPAHPTITDAQAYDLEWSTHWALNKMKAGYWRLWSCYKIVQSR